MHAASWLHFSWCASTMATGGLKSLVEVTFQNQDLPNHSYYWLYQLWLREVIAHKIALKLLL